MAYKPTNLRLPPDVRAWLRRKATDLDTTLTAVVTNAVRELMEAEALTCPACRTRRYPEHPDPLYDVMAHAQCDQIVAVLNEGAES